MVAGQAIDLSVAGSTAMPKASKADDETLRNLKTSALIRFSLRLGGMLSGANEKQLRQALSVSRNCWATLIRQAMMCLIWRKTPRFFRNSRVANYATELGVESAKKRVAQLLAQAKATLESEFGLCRAVFVLSQLADYVGERKA
ncbi:MAG: hypothetical protein WKF84_13005 [Pyrinomonadaceae bacterium]